MEMFHTEEEKGLKAKIPAPPPGWQWRKDSLRLQFELGQYISSKLEPDGIIGIPHWRCVAFLTYEFLEDTEQEFIDLTVKRCYEKLEEK